MTWRGWNGWGKRWCDGRGDERPALPRGWVSSAILERTQRRNLYEKIEQVIMVLKKSPGGSIYPYFYKGGALFGLHYGSFFKDEEGLLERMRAEEEFIANSIRQTPLWIDFYETRLTDTVLNEFSSSMLRLQGHITKLAIVGCSFKDKRRLMKLGKKSGWEFPMPVKFFSDPEEAKTWLMSETG